MCAIMQRSQMLIGHIKQGSELRQASWDERAGFSSLTQSSVKDCDNQGKGCLGSPNAYRKPHQVVDPEAKKDGTCV